jgi:tetratricopeptide (TPR) repeat protein
VTARGAHPVLALAACAALAGAVALQVMRDAKYPRTEAARANTMYVRSPEALKRIVLGFDALAADVYWIRALQHFGGERLDRQGKQTYDLLYPLLDLTTSLDPYFNLAYRFGAIFLSEPYPGGPGRPDQAIALLRKGIAAQPGRWQYYHDIAFVYYWQLRDYQAAAQWFKRASEQPGAPNWLAPMAATMLTHGRDRTSARFLWKQLLEADQEWLRKTAERSLLQLDAMDAVDSLQPLVMRAPRAPGEPYSWNVLVRRGDLRGVPLDPAGAPFQLDPATGAVTVSRSSPLFPLPDDRDRPGS